MVFSNTRTLLRGPEVTYIAFYEPSDLREIGLFALVVRKFPYPIF